MVCEEHYYGIVSTTQEVKGFHSKFKFIKTFIIHLNSEVAATCNHVQMKFKVLQFCLSRLHDNKQTFILFLLRMYNVIPRLEAQRTQSLLKCF